MVGQLLPVADLGKTYIQHVLVREVAEPVCRQLPPYSEHVRQCRLEHSRRQHQVAVKGARNPPLPGRGVARIVGGGRVVEDPPLHGEEVLEGVRKVSRVSKQPWTTEVLEAVRKVSIVSKQPWTTDLA